MRKTWFAFLFISLCVFFVGCQNDTIENKIKVAFKQYGNENFASKNSIKDYISIEPFDTISSQALIKSCEVFVNAELPYQAFYEVSKNDKYKNIIRNPKVPSRVREKLNDAITEMKESYIYINTSLLLAQANVKVAMDEAIVSDSVNIVQYKIKARIKENNISEVREYYAIVQNNDYDNIKIQDHDLKSSECPETITKLMSALGNFAKLYEEDTKAYNKLLYLLAECDMYLD